MSHLEDKWLARTLVACVVAVNAIALTPELTIGRVDLNDAVFHYTIADAIVNRIAHGRAALDFWMPEWSFGYPVLRAYQPLGAWLLAGVQLATGQHYPLDVTFAFVRWLLLAMFPLSMYAACRLIGLPQLSAAAAAIVAPLISSPNLYGLDYGSYLWRGNGLYTQLVAMHLFVLATGFGCRAIRSGRGITVAGLFVALTFLAHLIYGYMAAATVVLAVFFHDDESSRRQRAVRLAWIGALAFALTSFQLIPMLHDSAFINRSRWEAPWKWDSFGLKQVSVLVATGEIVDSQRFPVIALLALAGAIYAFRRRRDEDSFPLRLAIAGALFWMFFFAGPATWGPLLRVLGVGEQVQTHRFIGGLHVFLIILAGIGLSYLWSVPQRRGWRFATIASIAITLAVLALPIRDRREFIALDEKWGSDNLAAYDQQRPDIDRVTTIAKSRGGRTYPGLAASWGNQFKVGYVPFHAFLSRSHVPAIAFLYHAMALPADIMVRFDETRPEHYRLFDIRSVVAESNRQLPAFLNPLTTAGNFRVLNAPSASAFDLVSVPNSVYADRHTFYDVNDAWLQSAWVGARRHLLIDYESKSPSQLPRISSLSALSTAVASESLGAVTAEHVADDDYNVTVEVTRDCYLLLKSTFHPNWRAEVDGAESTVVMLTPGFAAVHVTPGHHTAHFGYRSGIARPLLLILALPLLALSFIAERKRMPSLLTAHFQAIRIPQIDLAHPLLVALLILPALAPVLGAFATSGHDALEYLPRLVEFHESIRHGILLPHWAPDLSSGQGQPIFLLNPPLVYFVADLWHLFGLSFARAINAAVATFIVGSALSMYLLARYWFGRVGGALAALAYVYAPYFLVDAYVRAAFAELSAFPFYPLAIYGFARHADERKLRYLAIAILGYAGAWFAHTPSAVLFSPLLGAYVIFLAWQKRSVKLFATHAAAIVIALALAAAVWIPAVTEASDTNSIRLTEGPLRYSNHFVYPRQLFGTGWGYGVSVPGDQDGMPFNLGWTHLLIAAIAVASLYSTTDRSRRDWIVFFVLATIAICYLVTPRSHAIWDALPQLHYVAFPWRLLADSAFTLSLLVGTAAWAIERVRAEWRAQALLAAIAILVLANVPHAQPQSYLSIDPAMWTPRQIASRGVLAATFDTFEPRWVQTRPVYNGGVIAVNRGAATASISEHAPERMIASVRAATDADLELPIAYFPGWRVLVDGSEVALDAPSEMGRMRVNVPAGVHRIEASFGRTPARTAAEIASVLGLIAVALLFFVDVRQSGDEASAESALLLARSPDSR